MPIANASTCDGAVRLPFAKATVEDAPRVDADQGTCPGPKKLVIPDILREHWFVNVRKFVVKADSIADLVQLDTLTRQAARFLEGAVASGRNVLAQSATATGVPDVARTLWEVSRLR